MYGKKPNDCFFKMEAVNNSMTVVPLTEPINCQSKLNKNTPVSKRKIDDIRSPLDNSPTQVSPKNDSIIFTQSTQESPDSKFRLVAGGDPANPSESNQNSSGMVKVGNKGRAKLLGGAKIAYQQTIPKRGTRRVQPARVKKSFKAKRFNVQDKKSKTTNPSKSPTFSPIANILPTVPPEIKESNPITRRDLEECLEIGFAKLKLEVLSREEVANALDMQKCKLLSEIASVNELVQSNAISINNHQAVNTKTHDDLEVLKHVVEQSEDERKSDFQFLSNKVNKLTANVTNVKKIAERSNTAMLSAKLTETNEKLHSEVETLRGKYSETKSELNSLCKEIDSLKVNFEKLKKNDLNTTTPSSTHPAQSIPAHGTTARPTDHSKSIIIEGVTENLDANLYDIVIDMMDELEITLHYWEINRVERIGRFNPNRSWPRPIRLSLIADWKRDFLLENADKLFFTEHYFRVTFKPDEPKDIRVAKAKLRQALGKAKRQGVFTRSSGNGIYINGIKYTTENVNEIPPRFTDTRTPPSTLSRPNQNLPHSLASSSQAYAPIASVTANLSMEIDVDQPNTMPENGDWIEPGIRKTEKGLAFFTFRAYMSNFHESPFTYKNENHKTGEHGLQMEKAWHHRDLNAVSEIRKASTPAEAKAAGSAIETSPEWNVFKYTAADNISYARYTQNPELANRLCDTGNTSLVEACTDTDWGIGISIWDDTISTGEGPGNNNFGKSTERVRSRLQKERREGKGIWST